MTVPMYFQVEHCPPPACIVSVILAETRLELDELALSIPNRAGWKRKTVIYEPNMAYQGPFWMQMFLEALPLTDMAEGKCELAQRSQPTTPT